MPSHGGTDVHVHSRIALKLSARVLMERPSPGRFATLTPAIFVNNSTCNDPTSQPAASQALNGTDAGANGLFASELSVRPLAIRTYGAPGVCGLVNNDTRRNDASA